MNWGWSVVLWSLAWGVWGQECDHQLRVVMDGSGSWAFYSLPKPYADPSTIIPLNIGQDSSGAITGVCSNLNILLHIEYTSPQGQAALYYDDYLVSSWSFRGATSERVYITPDNIKLGCATSFGIGRITHAGKFSWRLATSDNIDVASGDEISASRGLNNLCWEKEYLLTISPSEDLTELKVFLDGYPVHQMAALLDSEVTYRFSPKDRCSYNITARMDDAPRSLTFETFDVDDQKFEFVERLLVDGPGNAFGFAGLCINNVFRFRLPTRQSGGNLYWTIFAGDLPMFRSTNTSVIVDFDSNITALCSGWAYYSIRIQQGYTLLSTLYRETLNGEVTIPVKSMVSNSGNLTNLCEYGMYKLDIRDASYSIKFAGDLTVQLSSGAVMKKFFKAEDSKSELMFRIADTSRQKRGLSTREITTLSLFSMVVFLAVVAALIFWLFNDPDPRPGSSSRPQDLMKAFTRMDDFKLQHPLLKVD